MKAIDWKTPQAWNFEPIDNEKFPAVDLARRCGALGGAVAAMYNAANEVAVAAFMREEIAFTAIVDTIEKTVTTLGGHASSVVRDLADVSAIENDARRVAHEALAKR
jgi:1-deoxy-D-xylulose-5-phosphate reductoisomerase